VEYTRPSINSRDEARISILVKRLPERVYRGERETLLYNCERSSLD
jgi:hypothetical protein